MIRYIAAIGAISVLARLPGGGRVYRKIGEFTQRNTRGFELSLMRAGINVVKEALHHVEAGERVLDLGTGWYYKDALLYALTGRFSVTAFDVQNLARWRYVKNYLGLLDQHVSELADAWQLSSSILRGRLADWQSCDSLGELRDAAAIELLQGPAPGLPIADESVAFVSSYCVLPHISLDVLEAEFLELRRCLRPGGHMHHLIGYEDHYSFFDPQISPFGYYRYSDRSYRLLFQNSLQYQNRLLWPDYMNLFDRHGFRLVREVSNVSGADLEEIEKLKRDFDPRFREYSDENLAKRHSRVLLEKTQDS